MWPTFRCMADGLPRWLFERMTKLARGIAEVLVADFGPQEVLRRLSDPFWFQAFGCVLGFDWHSSGVTTTVCGALKEGIKGIEKELGFYVAGGKGRTSRKTPEEIRDRCQGLSVDGERLVYASRMAAKVDSAALQDGYQIYHHVFAFTEDGRWTVVQQGMNETSRMARRYHWMDSRVEDFVDEPHEAVCCDGRGRVFNMVAHESEAARAVSTRVTGEKPEKILKEVKKIQELSLPGHHDIRLEDLNVSYFHKILLKTYDRQPEDFETLLGLSGVGPKTIRALSLVSELLYGARVSHRDPARYSFAHGGKDGHPYPVDRLTYDQSIDALRTAVQALKIGRTEKIEALRRLQSMNG